MQQNPELAFAVHSLLEIPDQVKIAIINFSFSFFFLTRSYVKFENFINTIFSVQHNPKVGHASANLLHSPATTFTKIFFTKTAATAKEIKPDFVYEFAV